jgi:ABC-2 type transport system ATP-binding protein
MIEIRRLILRLAALGKTIFLSSHILHEVQQVCNRVGIMYKGNLVKQGNVDELLKAGEIVQIRMDKEEETHYAQHILQQAQEHDLNWISNVRLEEDKQNQPVLIIDAPVSRSSEINAILASHNLFAAEIRPREGSLEEVFLEATSSPTTGSRAGMEALAGRLRESASSTEIVREGR